MSATTKDLADLKRTERLRSRHVGRDVLVARWGWWGKPVLLFPTAGGDAEECERFKMIQVLRPLIEAGRVKVYSCDSVGGQALTQRRDHPPGWYPRMQNLFDRFVSEEFVPWIRRDCESADIGIVTAGSSIGAFNAAAAVCRHPDAFETAIAMSGTFDVSKWMEPGDLDLEFYFTSPIHFLPNLPEGPQLSKLRTRFLLIPTGEGDYEDPAQSWRLAKVLGSRGIPNRVDLWGPTYRHDWNTWREMLPKYLAEIA
jgi:esterase/lipase superfamily enzyme